MFVAYPGDLLGVLVVVYFTSPTYFKHATKKHGNDNAVLGAAAGWKFGVPAPSIDTCRGAGEKITHCINDVV